MPPSRQSGGSHDLPDLPRDWTHSEQPSGALVTRRGKTIILTPRQFSHALLLEFLLTAIRRHGVEPAVEYQFDVNRKWKFDLALPPVKIAIELQGGTFSGGRHIRGRGYENDCQKTLAAIEDGWVVLPITYVMLTEDLMGTLARVERIIEMRSASQTRSERVMR